MGDMKSNLKTRDGLDVEKIKGSSNESGHLRYQVVLKSRDPQDSHHTFLVRLLSLRGPSRLFYGIFPSTNCDMLLGCPPVLHE